jgi:hypothetical protein
VRCGKRTGSQKRRARAAFWLENDAWRWITAGGGGRRPEMVGGGTAAEEMPKEEGDGRGPKGLVGNYKNFKDLTENRNSPLIQSSDEKMVKMKVVELFKTYNFALGLKFRNLKYKVLFHYFALKSNFT